MMVRVSSARLGGALGGERAAGQADARAPQPIAAALHHRVVLVERAAVHPLQAVRDAQHGRARERGERELERSVGGRRALGAEQHAEEERPVGLVGIIRAMGRARAGARMRASGHGQGQDQDQGYGLRAKG